MGVDGRWDWQVDRCVPGEGVLGLVVGSVVGCLVVLHHRPAGGCLVGVWWAVDVWGDRPVGRGAVYGPAGVWGVGGALCE